MVRTNLEVRQQDRRSPLKYLMNKNFRNSGRSTEKQQRFRNRNFDVDEFPLLGPYLAA
jgi:hypothetical protein